MGVGVGRLRRDKTMRKNSLGEKDNNGRGMYSILAALRAHLKVVVIKMKSVRPVGYFSLSEFSFMVKGKEWVNCSI